MNAQGPDVIAVSQMCAPRSSATAGARRHSGRRLVLRQDAAAHLALTRLGSPRWCGCARTSRDASYRPV
ncbi:hypothetical protein [Streptomyces xanthochromogenes]|uniref:hypothetical protein n=1 Tax=Streptomyces xanthochromogenes TaxID=67384 RepID=UPI003428A2E4